MRFLLLLCLLIPRVSLAGVADGQAVNAAVTNAAFMDKNTATTFTIGKTDFQNTANAASGDGSIKSEGGGYITKDWWVNGFTRALGGLEISEFTDSTTMGANQDVTLSAPFTVFTNIGLTSIENFIVANRANATILNIKNATGGTVTLRNLSGGTASNQIDTGTGVDLVIANGGAAYVIYNPTASKWQTINLSGTFSGVLPIANGGTNSSTALFNNRVMISSANKIVEQSAITASRALASDASGLPVASTTTATELGFVSGVTSAIQTQLNGKQATGNYITALTGDVTATGPGSVAASVVRLQGVNVSSTAPTNTQVLTYNSTSTQWEPRTPATAGASVVGAFSGSSQPNGATISGSTITFGPADATNPGMVTTGTQSFLGAKTFSTSVTSPAFISSTANPATAGAIELANTNSINWRDAGNANNIGLTLNASNNFILGAAILPSSNNFFANGNGSFHWGAVGTTLLDVYNGNATAQVGEFGAGSVNLPSGATSPFLHLSSQTDGTTGTIFGIYTQNTNVASRNSQQINIETGNAAGATSGSGGISLTIGTATGSQGSFKLLKNGVPSVAGQEWIASGTDGTGYWASPQNAIFTTTYTATSADKFIFSNSTGATTLTLPDATVSGIVLNVKNINTGVLTINPVLSQTIDNNSAFGLNGQFQAITLESQGGEWWVY